VTAVVERTRVQERGVILALLVTFGAASLMSGTFVHRDNLYGILQDVTFEGFIAIGMAIALIGGEIDISVGSVYGLSGVITAVLLRGGYPLGVAMIAGLGVGLACGLTNGAVAWLIRVPAIIVTLATLGIYRGFSLVIANSADVLGLPPSHFFYSVLGQGTTLGGISWLTFMFLGVAVIGGVVLARTTFGFRVYAIGSNALAAHLIGMKVARVRILVLGLSGLCAGLAGVLSVAYLNEASPTGGQGYELDVLAALIIGGIKLAGGRGTILGAVLGLFIIGIVRNMLVLLGVSPSWQTGVSGAVLIIAVGFNRWSQAKEEEGGGRLT
jgi:ribose/xylose/arabinose/galactoside ABC-type transport system permease subunit